MTSDPASDPDASSPPKLSDEAMLARFQNSKKRPACSDTLGMRLISVDQANLQIAMEFDASPAFTNPSGAIQGGFLAAMLDEATSTCAIIASNVTMNAPTLEMKVSYLRPLFPGRAEARARILRWGKSICFIEAELFNAEGELVAKASSTQAPKPFRRF